VTFRDFLFELSTSMGATVPEAWQTTSEAELASIFLSKLNAYFFQTYRGIGLAEFEDEELQYFSDFHRFWEGNHREILNAHIDDTQAGLTAKCLSQAIRSFGPAVLAVTYSTRGLPLPAVAQVRFFTANQDFRQPPEDQFDRFLEDPGRFDATTISEEPVRFLSYLKMTSLSQTDKRTDFARNAAHFLLARGIRAIDIAQHYNQDAVAIRRALVDEPNMGYGLKKANMFIRDMFELGAWPQLQGIEQIDVASDINTMKLALRTGILRTGIPLLSSFLDQFCYQYGYIDEMSARAWREVWHHWVEADPETAPSSPCQMDYLLYRIGREYCKDNLVRYTCGAGHTFYHFGAGLKLCRMCAQSRVRTDAQPGERLLPCQVESASLPREDGQLLLPSDNLLKTFDGVCIFEPACRPKDQGFRLLDPPKSISVKGQTGWTSSYAIRERGGGGMMA